MKGSSTNTRRLPSLLLRGAASVATTVVLVGCTPATETPTAPPGQEEAITTETLELGAAALQSTAPLDPFNVYLVGFHPMKADPAHQMEAHHFCNQVNEEFAQCVLFDGNTRTANLNGIEYIISEVLFNALPAEEKQFWHPHNFEILSGQLVAPGIPAAAETELMRRKMNSYGKTWHTWASGGAEHEGDSMPLGNAMLAWSFNRDGEVMPGLVESRDERLGLSTEDIRDRRAPLTELAKPQQGVDALRAQFPHAEPNLPGVADVQTP